MAKYNYARPGKKSQIELTYVNEIASENQSFLRSVRNSHDPELLPEEIFQHAYRAIPGIASPIRHRHTTKDRHVTEREYIEDGVIIVCLRGVKNYSGAKAIKLKGTRGADLSGLKRKLGIAA